MNKQRWQDWVTTLVGIYVFLSPWIIPYVSPTSVITGPVAWAQYVAGAIAAVIGVAALASYQLWEEWVEIALGIWLVLSPWILGFADVRALVWSSVISGVILIAMAAGAIGQMKLPSQRRA